MSVAFISGHLDLTPEEFSAHYVPAIEKALAEGDFFVVGDARGADTMAQTYLANRGALAVVYHMFTTPRHNAGFPTKGGFTSDEERDASMTAHSDYDIAWIRPGREKSGTASNLKRRGSVKPEPRPLNQIASGRTVRVKQMDLNPTTKTRLREMGLGEEQQIKLLRGHTNIIGLVCNARLAISDEVAARILVEET